MMHVLYRETDVQQHRRDRQTRDLVMLSAFRTTFNCRQFCVELLPTPDVKLGRRPNETNIDLAMNNFAVDVRSSLPYLQCIVNHAHNNSLNDHTRASRQRLRFNTGSYSLIEAGIGLQ